MTGKLIFRYPTKWPNDREIARYPLKAKEKFKYQANQV